MSLCVVLSFDRVNHDKLMAVLSDNAVAPEDEGAGFLGPGIARVSQFGVGQMIGSTRCARLAGQYNQGGHSNAPRTKALHGTIPGRTGTGDRRHAASADLSVGVAATMNGVHTIRRP
jgi:hypothetical protein